MKNEEFKELVEQFEKMRDEYRKTNVDIKLTKRDFIDLCRFIKKALEQKGIDFEQFDILSEIDFSLSKDENKTQLKEKLKEMYGIAIEEEMKSNIEKWQKQQIEFWEQQQKEEFEEMKRKILENSDTDINKYFDGYENAINLFLNSEKKGLLVFGDKGKGKTFNTIRILEKLNKEFELVKGHITPLQLYKKLFENSNGILVFDDITDMLKDKKKMALLLGTLDKLGEVSWLSSNMFLDLPSKFNFNGKIIIILNKIDVNNEVQEALYDRCIPYQFDKLIDRNKMLEMITILAKKDNVSLEVIDWLNQNKIDISFRDYEMLRDIYKFNKENWQKMAEFILFNEVDEELNETDKKVLEIIRNHSNKSNNQKAKLFSDETGMNKRTFYRHLKKLRRLGLV
jgi:DNA-binding transcriptional ArsR family regulator